MKDAKELDIVENLEEFNKFINKANNQNIWLSKSYYITFNFNYDL